jgi:hypothetical protein
MKCFFIEDKKIILFPKLRKNNWKATDSALKKGKNIFLFS